MRQTVFVIAIVLIFILIFFAVRGIRSGHFTVEIGSSKTQLAKVIDKGLEDTTGTYAVALKNLKTGEEDYKAQNRVFDAGSLYKVWTLFTALRQIEKGELSEDEVIAGQIENINKILGQTTDEAELKSGTIDFTIKEAMQQMITISHNYAAVLLTEKVGTKNIQESLNALGLKDTVIDTKDRPKTTAHDILIFFEKVYKRDGVSAYVSNRITELLLEQELNDRIPKYLPNEAKVAHKTGEIDFQKHDAGIVFTPSGDYIIVVLSESDSPTAAAERIANISKAVYEYFASKN